MAAKRIMQVLVAGAALAALVGCDAINDRAKQFGELADDVMKQISGEEEAGDPLTEAPLEARALFGVMQAPVELAPITLEEQLQTQSFFAVGSVIAMPKEQMVEPVVEPESFDLAAAAAPETEADAAAAAAEGLNSSDAPPPESSNVAAGPPVTESAPQAPPPAAVAAPDQPPSVAAPKRQLALRSIPLKSATAGELREQSDVAAPKALERAVRDTGVAVTKESLRSARRTAEKQIAANTETAQSIGDEIVRKTMDEKAPIPKALAVRSKLNVEVAINARQKAQAKLEQMGLSGVVSPEEGGAMRIVIGVKPTQLGSRMDGKQVEAMRALFAQKKEKNSDECKGDPTNAQLQADATLATECVVKVLLETGDYEYVEKDYIFTNQFLKKPKGQKPATVAGVPNDPLFGLQWHFKSNGTGAGQSPGGASFANFWTKTKDLGSKSVTVAVVDTGLQMNHPDIKGSANLAPGYDMVSDPMMGNDGDGRDNDPNDPGDKCDLSDANTSDTFHGTHVSGTIGVASTNNANGIAGGAWNVTIVPVRALGRCGGKLSDINDAIRWAAGVVPARDAQGNEVWNSHEADIINLSIGLFEPCPASMQAAINDAVAAGAIVVAAAGNARVDAKYFAPGGCDNVISVAANDGRGVLTPYSNFGDRVTIMAPGGDMTRDDDKDGRPDGVLSTKFSKNCYDPAKPGTQVAQCYYAFENGTSMAAPHVSAALALIKAKFPAALPSELRSKLLTSSSKRTELQCSGKCSNYPGTKPIPGSEDMCFRPCGGAMLNLSNAPVQ
ncbi:MAG: S8 family peptidase [Hyphomonadaceae bacterium]|nr:S8 family peptidase [Hyphomonadaceae bacterium]